MQNKTLLAGLKGSVAYLIFTKLVALLEKYLKARGVSDTNILYIELATLVIVLWVLVHRA